MVDPCIDEEDGRPLMWPSIIATGVLVVIVVWSEFASAFIPGGRGAEPIRSPTRAVGGFPRMRAAPLPATIRM
jgi:hypothetical protein